jgi:cytochrome b561
VTIANTPATYGWLARALHWGTAALMLPTLAIAAYMSTREENVPGDPQKYFAVLPWHKTLGFLVLLVLVVRLPWYLRSVHPAPPPATSRATARAATWVHAALYALMVALPVLGYIGSSAGPGTFRLFTLWQMPRLVGRDQALSSAVYDVHVALGWTAAVLVAGHIGAAIWHQWIRRDGALRRMWRGDRSIFRPEK